MIPTYYNQKTSFKSSAGVNIELYLFGILYCKAERNYMKKEKVKTEYIHCRFDKPTRERLDQFCTDTGLTKTTAIERALKRYLDNFDRTGRV